jgi:hypothetical protein
MNTDKEPLESAQSDQFERDVQKPVGGEFFGFLSVFIRVHPWFRLIFALVAPTASVRLDMEIRHVRLGA